MAERVYIKSTLAAVVLLAAAGWTASASAGDETTGPSIFGGGALPDTSITVDVIVQYIRTSG